MTAMEISIQWLSDSHECETCGSSYADGARISIGSETIELTPVADCFGGANWDRDEVYKVILAHLGHTVIEIEEPAA